MKELTQAEKATNYKTLLHIMNVRNTIDKVLIILLSGIDDAAVSSVIRLLLQRAKDHDASKLKAPELSTFVEFSSLFTEKISFGSPEYAEFLKGMGEALIHHYKNNRHHPEHYKVFECSFCQAYHDLLPDRCSVCGEHSHFEERFDFSKMNLIDLLEMLCDWKASNLLHSDGSIQNSISICQKKFKIPDGLTQILRNTADLLED